MRGRVLVQDDLNVRGAPLHALNGLPVRSTDAIGFDGIDLVDKAVCLIGQLTDDMVPLCEALVAAAAVREDPGEPAGTDVAAWTRNTLHADAATAAFVTLLL